MTKPTMNINDFTKTLTFKTKEGGTREHKIFDYDKIWEDPSILTFIVSARGEYAKTTGSKSLMKSLDESGINSVVTMNTDKQLIKEKTKYLKDMKRIYPDIFENVDVDNTGVYSYELVEKENKKTGELTYSRINKQYYTYFNSIGGADKAKGSRDRVGLIVYEEPNVGLKDIRGDQTDLFFNLIATYTDAVDFENSELKKIIVHLNYKSLNLPLLFDLGIYAITEEVTRLKAGKFNILILKPILSENDKIKKDKLHEDDPIYQLTKLAGREDHIYFNENLEDDTQNVEVRTEAEIKQMEEMWVIFFKDYYYKIYRYYDKTSRARYHIVHSNEYKGTKPVYRTSLYDVREGMSRLHPDAKNDFKNLVVNDKVTFQTLVTRVGFIKSLVTS